MSSPPQACAGGGASWQRRMAREVATRASVVGDILAPVRFCGHPALLGSQYPRTKKITLLAYGFSYLKVRAPKRENGLNLS